jgi:predicted Zn-dependent protease
MSQRLSPLTLTLSLILVLAPAVPSTAQSIRLPDIGDPSQADFGPDEEQKMGLDIMRRLRERGVLIDDVQLNEYLNSIGQNIATYADQNGTPFTFFMVRDSGINAFALPHNFIGINTGLLLATQREDELAGVIAHEIAHVSQHHIVRAIADMKRMTLPLAAAMIAGAALAAASKQAGQAAMVGSMAAGAQHQISFTRVNEQEADRVGMQFLAKAGFDPKGMSDFFAKLERLSSGEARNQVPEILLTHPRPESRVADTQDRVEIPPMRRTASRDRKAYDLAKARARVLATDDNGSLIRDLETTLAKGGYASETAERYAYALALRQAGRYDAAGQQVTRLLQSDSDRLAFRIEAAELALARGDRAQGWRLFETARQLYPDDFTLAMSYGRALATQGDPKLAMRLMQPHLRRRPNDPLLYASYAQAAQRSGDLAATHSTMAEYHYLNGELLPAIEQLELGLRNPGLSPNQEAQLRARLKQIRAEAIAQDLPVPKRDAP